MIKEEAILVSAYTWTLLTKDFSDVHEFCEKLLGRPIFTHEFADAAFQKKIQKKCRPLIEEMIEHEDEESSQPDSALEVPITENEIIKCYHARIEALTELCNCWEKLYEAETERLKAEMANERHRHDRYIDFELAQAKELEVAKEKLKGECEACMYEEKVPDDCDIGCQDCKRPCFCHECRNGDRWKWRFGTEATE